MKLCVLVFTLVIFLTVARAEDSGAPTCSKLNDDCKQNEDCCSGLCIFNKCGTSAPGAPSTLPPIDCSMVQCKLGKVCDGKTGNCLDGCNTDVDCGGGYKCTRVSCTDQVNCPNFGQCVPLIYANDRCNEQCIKPAECKPTAPCPVVPLIYPPPPVTCKQMYQCTNPNQQ